MDWEQRAHIEWNTSNRRALLTRVKPENRDVVNPIMRFVDSIYSSSNILHRAESIANEEDRRKTIRLVVGSARKSQSEGWSKKSWHTICGKLPKEYATIYLTDSRSS